jgi:hypothetical protein
MWRRKTLRGIKTFLFLLVNLLPPFEEWVLAEIAR